MSITMPPLDDNAIKTLFAFQSKEMEQMSKQLNAICYAPISEAAREAVANMPLPPLNEYLFHSYTGQWVKVIDGLPFDGEQCLAVEDGDVYCVEYRSGIWHCLLTYSDEGIELFEVTHWMALPEAPK